MKLDSDMKHKHGMPTIQEMEGEHSLSQNIVEAHFRGPHAASAEDDDEQNNNGDKGGSWCQAGLTDRSQNSSKQKKPEGNLPIIQENEVHEEIKEHHNIQMETPKPSNMNSTFLQEVRKEECQKIVIIASPIKEEPPSDGRVQI